MKSGGKSGKGKGGSGGYTNVIAYPSVAGGGMLQLLLLLSLHYYYHHHYHHILINKDETQPIPDPDGDLGWYFSKTGPSGTEKIRYVLYILATLVLTLSILLHLVGGLTLIFHLS